MMTDLIPKHGGYENLLSFTKAQLVFDITVRFSERYIEKGSRTRDQMDQAARSGVQNIAEGSEDSATSKKMELKLTQVARGSLEELKLDYQDFLRQRNLPMLAYDSEPLIRLKSLKPENVETFAGWVAEERKLSLETERVREAECRKEVLSSAALAANGALSLLNLACYLLDKQVQSLAAAFDKDGGFTERMYRRRRELRDKK